MTILEIHMHVPTDVAFSCRALVDLLEPIPGRQGSGLKAGLEGVSQVAPVPPFPQVWVIAVLGSYSALPIVVPSQMPEVSKQATQCSGAVVPKLFDTRDLLHGRRFFHGRGYGEWFGDDSSALHLLCTWLLLLLHRDI